MVLNVDVSILELFSSHCIIDLPLLIAIEPLVHCEWVWNSTVLAVFRSILPAPFHFVSHNPKMLTLYLISFNSSAVFPNSYTVLTFQVSVLEMFLY